MPLRTTRAVLALAITASVCSAAARAQTNTEDAAVVVLHPKAITRPLLQYTLLPRIEDVQTGNAAMLYSNAVIILNSGKRENDDNDKLQEFTRAPLDTLSDEALGSARVPMSVLHQLELGARMDKSDWSHPLRLEGYNTMLPAIGPMRVVTRGAALEARLAMKKKDYPDALRWIQTNYALARDLSRSDTIIEGLVAAVIANETSDQVRTFIQQPDAPNLFWAVTTLPAPLVDMQRGFRDERGWIYFDFPELAEARRGVFHPGQLAAAMQHFAGITQAMGSKTADVPAKLAPVAAGLAGYGIAKRYLADHGFTSAQIQAMPVEEAMLRYIDGGYEEAADNLLTTILTPAWQNALHPLPPEETKAREDALDSNLLARVMLPSLSAATMRLEEPARNLAALGVLEALRDYAARHDGALPAKLDDIGLPVPWDPIWNRPFDYTVNGNDATLSSAKLPMAGARSAKWDIHMEK